MNVSKAIYTFYYCMLLALKGSKVYNHLINYNEAKKGVIFMKKVLAAFLACSLIFLLSGCSLKDPKYINLESKPSEQYYTQELKDKLSDSDDFKVSILDTNFYKEKQIPKEENKSFIDFINSIHPEYYKEASVDKTKRCLYKVYVTIKNSKYLLKVYENEIITIAPWDGVFDEDVLSELSIPPGQKLISICKHYIK